MLLSTRKISSLPLVWCALTFLCRLTSSFCTFSPPKRFLPRLASRTTETRMTSIPSSDLIKGKTIVSIPEAIQLHGNDDVKFVDGSWFLMGRHSREEFQAGPRIAGAHFFDIDDISTPSSLPHMMPPKELFAAAMDAMGISNEDHVIVYGSKDCVSLPYHCHTINIFLPYCTDLD